MANIPISFSLPNSSETNDFFKKCLINYRDSRLPFEKVCSEIENTWKEKSEEIKYKTWTDIESMFETSAGEAGSLKKIIAIKVSNTHLDDLDKIKIEWLPYDGTNRRKLSDLHPDVLVYLFPYDLVYEEIRNRNRNSAKLGLCARVAKVEEKWIVYLMVYANKNDNLQTRFSILYTGASHAGGGNSGVRIPPLTDE